ncbi:MAG: ABC-type transport auxiliary lipoprotein family protein [Salinisphaera sp.]|jgi:uncharacterized lipoprotein YmbA|nr:ABC-type transport auxiliary lipoprotein family protein [Salinisphaera sp.]
MMRHRFLLAALLLLAIALAGCATTAGSPSLFVLDATQAPATNTHPDNAPILVVTPVTLAPYLDQGGIVYQTAPYRVIIANDNRWAAPLAGELTDTLYASLTNDLHGIDLLRSGTDKSKAYRLNTRVDEFMGHYDGRAHATGQWSLVAPDGQTVITKSFEKLIPLGEDGYPALVGSLSRAWRQIAADMAPELQSAIEPTQSH